MASARRTKTADEITCLDVASAIAEAALTAMDDALAPGITERELLGIYDERIASLGAPMPPSESVCFATPSSGPVRFRHLASDRPIGDGELVVLAPGALYAGYEAGLARTRVAGNAAPPRTVDLASRCARGMDALIAACRPGNTGADLYRAWENAGNPDPGVPLAHGLGLGAEPPLIGLGRGRDATIDEGMVLSVQSWVTEEGVGGCLERGTVRVEGSGPIGTHALRKVVMTSHRTVFNHVGLCVADRERSRRFYEGLLGLQVLVGTRTARRGHRRSFCSWPGRSECVRRIWCATASCSSSSTTRNATSTPGPSASWTK